MNSTPEESAPESAPEPFWVWLKTMDYALDVSPIGATQSRYRGLALTRWRDDAVEDTWGWFLYLRDLASGDYTSIGQQPIKRADAEYGFEQGWHWAELRLDWQGIRARWRMKLNSDLNMEARTLTLENCSGQHRELELTSYLEVVLTDIIDDSVHPAFLKLFIETAWDEASGCLLAQRRIRRRDESWPCLWHTLLGADAPLEFDTDRMSFLGRGRGPERPLAMEQPHLQGRLGKVLDPVFGLRTRLTLAPGETKTRVWLLGAAQNAEMAQKDALEYIELCKASVARLAKIRVPEGPATLAPNPGLNHWNGIGGFDPASDAYVLHLNWDAASRSHRLPPLPWINVIANPLGGCIISERGAGYSWFGNSQANRISPWLNDPVSDGHGEALYLRDPTSGHFWSPLPGPAPAEADYLVTHRPGLSRFELSAHGWHSVTEISMSANEPLRLTRLKLRNDSDQSRSIQFYSYLRLILDRLPPTPGRIQTDRMDWIIRNLDLKTPSLWAKNHANHHFHNTAFCMLLSPEQPPEQTSASCDRLTFVGRHGRLSAPLALSRPSGLLDGNTQSPEHPCFALQGQWRLAPGAELEILLLLGEAEDIFKVEPMIKRWLDFRAELATSRDLALDIASRLQVDIPEPSLMPLLNHWLPWQVLGCRIWARSALYQSGGAYGYRDQLQDAAGLLPLAPEQTRAAILRHAAVQFSAGDVCHWWHPEPMAHGLRSRCSDDLLWLPRVCADYLSASGDWALLDEDIPFLDGPELPPDRDDYYMPLRTSDQTGSLYEHCCRALDRSLTLGAHGLPLIGTGDWNDGMNRLGHMGRGESVWLAFFLYQILGDWLPICERRKDEARKARYSAHRERLLQGLDAHGWDGGWYRRAYDDDGRPLGSQSNSECRIDALVQSWAVISQAAPEDKARQAMAALERHLIDKDAGIIRLLTPPFVNDPRDPGYIKGYVAGVRENGGQYSHAACWVVQATALLGDYEEAWALLKMLSPINHSDSPERLAIYKGEPYVLAADVYGAKPHLGRAGWTWYTGAAGWFYRIAIETLLGFRIQDGTELHLAPHIPRHWPGFGIDYGLPAGGRLRIRVDNASGEAGPVRRASLDDQPLACTGDALRLTLPKDGQDHELLVWL